MKPNTMCRGGLAILIPLSLAMLLYSCGQPELKDSKVKREWTSDDNPSVLARGFTYEYSKLPRSGAATKVPWAGSYWPTYKDSINDKWDGGQSDSPAKKYEKAFKISFNLEDRISNSSGIGSMYGKKKCSDNSKCDKDDVCAKRSGATEGICMPTWFGLCHAWAPAAIMEPEPVKPVEYNGITFKVNDIKALLTLSYSSGLDATLMSRRCDLKANKVKLDMYGNPIDMSCIDTNPGSLHVVVTNMLGLRKQSFIEDRQWDSEVWNHPINSYSVNIERDVSIDQANTLIGILGDVISTDKKSGELKEHNWSDAWVHDVSDADGVAVSLTGDMDVDLYVRFDAEPTENSFNCRSSSPTPNETCILKIPPNTKKVYTKVYAYKDNGKYSAEFRFTKKSWSRYTLNPKAVNFKYINMSMSIIGESEANTDGNLAASIENYVMKDTYDYILELDAEGKIIGGEWLAASRTNHPDFLWLPLKKFESVVSGVDWKNVKMLLEKSVAKTGGGLIDPPYCVANNGRGEGDIFDCLVNGVTLKCAKTDTTYSTICISSVHDEATPYNLVDNPSFESDGYAVDAVNHGISGWKIWMATPTVGVSFVDSSNPHSGAFKAVHRYSANYAVYTYQVKSGLANGIYTLKAWVKSSGGQYNAQMEAKDYGGAKLVQNIPPTSSWQQIVIDDIHVTNGSCTFGFYSNALAYQWIAFDDIEFYKKV